MKDWKKEYNKMVEVNEFFGLPYDDLTDKSIKNFISQQRKAPMGVSQWREYGNKYHYWQYFEEEVRKEVLEEYAKFLSDNCKEGETIEITIDKYLKSLINKQ